jgi:hypothetical protein
MIRLAMLSGTKHWVVKKKHVNRMTLGKMKMLRWISGNTMKYKVRNKVICSQIGVAPIG